MFDQYYDEDTIRELKSNCMSFVTMSEEHVYYLVFVEAAFLAIFLMGTIVTFCRHGPSLKGPTRNPLVALLLMYVIPLGIVAYLQYGVIAHIDHAREPVQVEGFRQIQLNIIFFGNITKEVTLSIFSARLKQAEIQMKHIDEDIKVILRKLRSNRRTLYGMLGTFQVLFTLLTVASLMDAFDMHYYDRSFKTNQLIRSAVDTSALIFIYVVFVKYVFMWDSFLIIMKCEYEINLAKWRVMLSVLSFAYLVPVILPTIMNAAMIPVALERDLNCSPWFPPMNNINWFWLSAANFIGCLFLLHVVDFLASNMRHATESDDEASSSEYTEPESNMYAEMISSVPKNISLYHKRTLKSR